MPKIRGIKPDYWTDEDIVELSLPARLLFIGLWNFACDNGHLDDKPKQIKMRILPGDDISVEKLLNELVENGRITRENGTITIRNFALHQKPHPRWWTCCDTPGCAKPDKSTTVADLPTKGSNNGGPRETAGDNGRPTAELSCIDGDGDGELKVATSAKPKRAIQIPGTWKPNSQHVDFAATAGLVVAREAERFRDHHQSKGSTMKDWDAAFRNWLRNAVEYGRGRPALTPVPNGPVDPSTLPPVEQSWMRRRLDK